MKNEQQQLVERVKKAIENTAQIEDNGYLGSGGFIENLEDVAQAAISAIQPSVSVNCKVEHIGSPARYYADKLLSQNGYVISNSTGNPYEQLVAVIDEAMQSSVSVNEGMLEALQFFVMCSYPVAEVINKRGYNWQMGRLDEVLILAKQAITNATSAKAIGTQSVQNEYTSEPIDPRDAIIAKLKETIKTIKFATCRSSIPDLNFNAEELEDLQGASGTQQKYILLEKYIKRIAEQTLALVEKMEKQS